MSLYCEKKPVALGAGLWFNKWFVVNERLSGNRVTMAIADSREEAEQWIENYESDWESKDE